MRKSISNGLGNAFTVDVNAHPVSGPHGSIGLTPREFNLLTCLMRNEGHPMSRSDLLRDAWEWDFAGELKTKTVDMHIRRLRKKLEQAGCNPRLIITVRGRGYAFNGNSLKSPAPAHTVLAVYSGFDIRNRIASATLAHA